MVFYRVSDGFAGFHIGSYMVLHGFVRFYTVLYRVLYRVLHKVLYRFSYGFIGLHVGLICVFFSVLCGVIRVFFFDERQVIHCIVHESC